MSVNVSANQKQVCWLDDFLDYTDGLPSPTLWRKWAGISAIASVLERRVWITTRIGRFYPNMYIVLVGPPGAGKSILTNIVSDVTNDIEDFHKAPSNVSGASMLDALDEARRRIVRLGLLSAVIEYNALCVLSNELGSFIPAWDAVLINALTDIYDGKTYIERKRGRKTPLEIKNPCLNILGATTPGWLSSQLPPGAWDQGFTSRTLFIYSGDVHLVSVFGDAKLSGSKFVKVSDALRTMTDLYGEYSFEEAAAAALDAWHMAGGPPAPDHPKLLHYLSRRTSHLLKLCMVVAAATRKELIITLDDFQTALSLLLEAETFMPEIFLAMTSGGDSDIHNEAWHFVYKLYMKKNMPVPQASLIAFLRQRTPSHSVMKMYELMIHSRMIKPVVHEGQQAVIPLDKLT